MEDAGALGRKRADGGERDPAVFEPVDGVGARKHVVVHVDELRVKCGWKRREGDREQNGERIDLERILHGSLP